MTARPTRPSPKEKLIETAAELVYRQGWNSTGINQILKVSDVPKGSFYYYFESKEDLGVAVVEHQAKALLAACDRTLLNTAIDGRTALESFFKDRIEFHRKIEGLFGCPVGSVSNEVSVSGDHKMAQACRKAFDDCLEAMGSAIRRGQSDGSLPAKGNPEVLALLLASAWQGGLLFMKMRGEAAPFELVQSGIAEAFLRSPT